MDHEEQIIITASVHIEYVLGRNHGSPYYIHVIYESQFSKEIEASLKVKKYIYSHGIDSYCVKTTHKKQYRFVTQVLDIYPWFERACPERIAMLRLLFNISG